MQFESIRQYIDYIDKIWHDLVEVEAINYVSAHDNETPHALFKRV